MNNVRTMYKTPLMKSTISSVGIKSHSPIPQSGIVRSDRYGSFEAVDGFIEVKTHVEQNTQAGLYVCIRVFRLNLSGSYVHFRYILVHLFLHRCDVRTLLQLRFRTLLRMYRE